MKDAISRLIGGDEYRRQTDGPDGGKALLVRATVEAYKAGARAQLLRESPGLERAITEKTRERAEKLTPKPGAVLPIPSTLPSTLGL